MQMLYIFYNTCIIFEFSDPILHTSTNFQFIFIKLNIEFQILKIILRTGGKKMMNNNALIERY